MKRATLLLCALSIFAIPEMSRAGIFEDYPDIIVCNEVDIRFVLYIDRLQRDGTLLYRGGGGGVIKVDKNGVLIRPNTNCHGKTIEELREKGQTFDITG